MSAWRNACVVARGLFPVFFSGVRGRSGAIRTTIPSILLCARKAGRDVAKAAPGIAGPSGTLLLRKRLFPSFRRRRRGVGAHAGAGHSGATPGWAGRESRWRRRLRRGQRRQRRQQRQQKGRRGQGERRCYLAVGEMGDPGPEVSGRELGRGVLGRTAPEGVFCRGWGGLLHGRGRGTMAPSAPRAEPSFRAWCLSERGTRSNNGRPASPDPLHRLGSSLCRCSASGSDILRWGLLLCGELASPPPAGAGESTGVGSSAYAGARAD